MTPSPATTVTKRNEYQHFSRHGFVSLPRPLISAAGIAEVRAMLDSVMSAFLDLPDRWRSELGMGKGTAIIHEVQYVAKLLPELRDTEAYHVAFRVAQELLGAENIRMHFDHMIVKPGGSTAPTAWHQDVAFDPSYDCPMATMWIPLQAVDNVNGCMHFVSLEHCPEMLPHQKIGVDGRGVLNPPVENEVVCPLPLGGLTVHGARTLHGSGTNASNASRLAWIVKFIIDDRNPVRQRAALAAHARYWRSVSRRPLSERFDTDFSREY